MNSLLSKIRNAGFGLGATLLFAAPAFAQAIPVAAPQTETKLGNVTNFTTLVNFILNFINILGWIGVVMGIALAIFGLIYKLMATDSEEAMKTVQGYLTKALLIAVAGALLLSFGYFIQLVFGWLNITTPGINNVGTPTIY